MNLELGEGEVIADDNEDDVSFFADLISENVQAISDNSSIINNDHLYSKNEKRLVELLCGSSHKKLLSQDEELQLLLIRDRFKRKVAEIGADNIPEDEKRIAQKAECELVTRNIRYVIYIIKTYFPHVMDEGRFLEFQDVVQNGVVGLIKGIRHFDASLGWRLTTYVGWWVRQNISRSIFDTEDMIRLPVHIHDAINKIYIAKQECYEIDHIHDPDIIDIAFRSSLDIDRVRKLMALPKVFSDSYYYNVGDEEVSLVDSYVDESVPRPDTLCENGEIQYLVNRVLDSAKLKDIERDVIKYRFGIGGFEESTLETIGEVYGLTRERIRQIEAKAIKSLRNEFKKAKITCC